MGITISYPEADLYWGAMNGTLSGEDAYKFFMQYGYWPNEATRNAGLTYMGQNGYATNQAGTFGDPNDPYSGFEVIAQNSTAGQQSPTYIAGNYYMPMYDPMGNFTHNQLTDAQGNPIQQQQTDWFAEAAQGHPVIGPAVTPNSSVADYNQYSTTPTIVQPNSPGEQAVIGTGGFINPTSSPNWWVDPTIQTTPQQTAPQGQTDLQQLAANLPQGTPTNVTGGGTISNFWDNTPAQGNTQSGYQSGYGDLENMFNRWFKDTYGSGYGIGG